MFDLLDALGPLAAPFLAIIAIYLVGVMMALGYERASGAVRRRQAQLKRRFP
ncbi:MULTISPECIES: hypothetical protein [Ferrimonas]|uniref:hypothetical protein n=1 Tax=Ferrimonas TaxID=44011 RepID=UPI0003FC0246|nr:MULTISPECIES: hypothetical protein [Ferrimonas]USD35860.1 hypothetical protein J8Z22_12480 [Ferrimonas sp. SCSIO 43195]